MLATLCIENFAIVKQLELDFSQGMTAFTGETGAGKSIMIDALLLALGGRADASVVRTGAEKCDITANFLISADSAPALWLAENDITCGEELILRRVLYSEGRSKSYINGQVFPLQKVKELSEMLVHIHGQHQHQTLMQHSTHREQLDHYAMHGDILQDVHQNYKKSLKIKQELDALHNQDNQNDKRNLLCFQLEELADAQLQDGEMQALHNEHQLLHHAKDYLMTTQAIQQALEGDDAPSILTHLNQILHLLNDLPKENKTIQTIQELMNTAYIQCEEALSEIQHFSEQVQLDPERLEMVESRISMLHQLARKYHIEASALPQWMESLKAELNNIENREGLIQQLQQEFNQITQIYESSAFQLRQSRQQFAQKLEKEITASIQQLGMPKGEIAIEFTPLDKMQPHGLDKIEYKVRTNPGMLPDTLSKIASGGELSRISLAIQMITAQRGATPTLIFDEVDVGIGGSTAALVGQMLRKLGERLQVFCVTHQPQVASAAHHHFVVDKHSDAHETYTTIADLKQGGEKINEIARMLGGLKITEQTKLHAQELLKSCQD